MNLKVAGIASCAGGISDLCSLGPLNLKHSRQFHRLLRQQGIQLNWDRVFHPDYRRTTKQIIRQLGREVSDWSKKTAASGKTFVAFGGDHSSAMGIWRGVMSALAPDRRLGLIWIDAHLDLHNFRTSPSGNIHGMPLAALLGQGDEQLSEIYGPGPFLEPKNLVIVGSRSYEAEEEELVRALNIHCIPSRLIGQRASLTEILEEAVSIVRRDTDAYGISLDLDALDPESAPAVGTPASGGIGADELREAFCSIRRDSGLIGIEIAEYYPRFDRDQRTLRLIADLLSALFGRSKIPNRFFGSSGAGIRSTSLPKSNSPASS
jgi:arginase